MPTALTCVPSTLKGRLVTPGGVWGCPQQGVGQIAGGLVINDVVDTNVPEKSALVRAPCRSYDRVPFKLGNLASDRPNSTSRGRDKHHIARLKRGYLQKA